jgi:hypothetical protein
VTETASARELGLRFVITALIAALLTFELAPTHPDFAMIWAGAQLAHPYHPVSLNSLIFWPPERIVAYVYPPNATLLFRPFALVPLPTALLLWTALGGGLLGLCTRWAPALVFTPPVIWALPGGQTSLILGTLLFLAFRYLEKPILAGVLLGVALILKPQLAFIASAGLILKDLRISSYAGGALLLSIAFSVVQGFSIWAEWLNSLTPWLDLHSSNQALLRNEIAHGLPIWLRACVAVAGVAFVAAEPNRLTAFTIAVCTALIASPHAMGYEFAMIAPAILPLVRSSTAVGVAAVAFFLTPALIWIFPDVLSYSPRLIITLILISCVAAPTVVEQYQGLRRKLLCA